MSFDPVNRPYSILSRQPYPFAFVTVSGSHLYGFPSADSDFDLRGVHVAPAAALLGLDPVRETIEDSTTEDGPLDELVSHDAAKYFRLLLRNNGYVLEQIFSPLVIVEGILPRLRPIAKRCVTRRHYKHYCGFALNEWTQFHRRPEKAVKRILYVLRVLLTGIHLLRTGEVEANLLRLNESFALDYVPELIEAKVHGVEDGSDLPKGRTLEFYRREVDLLFAKLESELETSNLPEETDARIELNSLLLELRGVAPSAESAYG